MLPAPAGHWNSPIVVDGHVIEPIGNDNDHQTTRRGSRSSRCQSLTSTPFQKA